MTTPIAALIELIKALRGEKGCPWDRAQTPTSIAVYLIEEVYELVDALDRGNTHAICDELGDVLFHVLFIAHLFQEQGAFDIDQAARANHAKMVRRHPHVFGIPPWRRPMRCACDGRRSKPARTPVEGIHPYWMQYPQISRH